MAVGFVVVSQGDEAERMGTVGVGGEAYRVCAKTVVAAYERQKSSCGDGLTAKLAISQPRCLQIMSTYTMNTGEQHESAEQYCFGHSRLEVEPRNAVPGSWLPSSGGFLQQGARADS